jgi:hypothetical protein
VIFYKEYFLKAEISLQLSKAKDDILPGGFLKELKYYLQLLKSKDDILQSVSLERDEI